MILPEERKRYEQQHDGIKSVHGGNVDDARRARRKPTRRRPDMRTTDGASEYMG